MTGYIIHYTGGSGSTGTVTASASSTSVDITGLTDGDTYTISVEANSVHMSGESETMTITLGRSHYYDYPCSHLCPITVPPPDPPEGVMAFVGSASVTVFWEAVTDADSYTVTFTRATGADQQGGCPGGSHTASVSVDAPTITASINIEQNVESTAADILTAYSTYFITVVAVNGGGSSVESGQISVMTPQTGTNMDLDVCCFHFAYAYRCWSTSKRSYCYSC